MDNTIQLSSVSWDVSQEAPSPPPPLPPGGDHRWDGDGQTDWNYTEIFGVPRPSTVSAPAEPSQSGLSPLVRKTSSTNKVKCLSPVESPTSRNKTFQILNSVFTFTEFHSTLTSSHLVKPAQLKVYHEARGRGGGVGAALVNTRLPMTTWHLVLGYFSAI